MGNPLASMEWPVERSGVFHPKSLYVTRSVWAEDWGFQLASDCPGPLFEVSALPPATGTKCDIYVNICKNIQ